MPIIPLDFNTALASAHKNRHLLLGNGFSISCRPEIFKYEALYKQADFTKLSPNVKNAFEALNTQDFETVMRALRYASQMVKVYSKSNDSLAKKMASDAEKLKEVLVKTIAGSHPEQPSDISNKEYIACRTFLGSFNDVYTLNYDLLLYWALMNVELSESIPCDDGFRTPDEGTQEYVTWDIEKTNKQNIFYLHGALHIFDAGDELKKYTWKNTGKRLITQIREALESNLYPLIVTEGQSKNKLTKINHSSFLSRGLRSFSHIGGSLFVFGHSFNDNDDHIIRMISKNKVSELFVSIYDDCTSDKNKSIIQKANSLGQSRKNKVPLQVKFFQAETAKVWGK